MKHRKFNGEIVRKIRLEAGLTLQQLEQLTGIAWNQIWKWEMNKQVPSANNVAILEDILNCPAGYFMDYPL